MEIWKDITHLPTPPEFTYQVSNLGNVRSLNYNRTGLTRNLQTQETPTGHTIVMMAGVKRISVAQLVLNAFGDLQPSDKHIVQHKNGISNDNSLENLEWVDMGIRNKISGKNGFKFPKGHQYGVESRFKKGENQKESWTTAKFVQDEIVLLKAEKS